jgi:hypothetical protein
VSIGDGSYSITVTDPVDGDLQNRSYDPVCIEVVGKTGRAIYRSKVNADIKPADGSCLDVAIMSGGAMTFAGANVSTDKAIASNGSISSSSSQINADVEASGIASGSTYKRSATNSVSQRAMPKSAELFVKYNAASQLISASSLPLFTRTEIISNTTFETSSNGWAAFPLGSSCQLNRGPAKARTGNRALEVKQRDNANCIAKYSATSADTRLARFISGHQYSLTIPVNVKDNAYIKVVCTLTSSQTAIQTFQSDNWFVAYKDTSEPKDYTIANITFRPIFAGTPTLLEVYVLFANSDTDYNIDDPTLTDITYPDNCRVFERTALTPALNPYGTASGTGNYRFECGGQNVAFGYGRIVGTVILSNPGSLSGIYGPMDWQPMLPTAPAILSTGKLMIDQTALALNESDINANLNASGAPYPYIGGNADNDTTDSYASLIRGLIYCADDLAIPGVLRSNGVVVSGGNVSTIGGDIVVTYDRSIAEDPPAGFDVGLIDINIAPGSWTKVVQ